MSNKDTVQDAFRTQLMINKKHSLATLFGKDNFNLKVLIEKNSNNILHIKVSFPKYMIMPLISSNKTIIFETFKEKF